MFYCTFSSKYWILEIWRRKHIFSFMLVSFLFITSYFNLEYRWENTRSWFTFSYSNVAYKSKTMFQSLLEHSTRAPLLRNGERDGKLLYNEHHFYFIAFFVLFSSFILSLFVLVTIASRPIYHIARGLQNTRANQPLCLSIYPLCMFILWNLSSSGVEKHSGHNLHLNDSPLYIIPHVGIR